MVLSLKGRERKERDRQTDRQSGLVLPMAGRRMFSLFVESFKSGQQACIVLTFEKCKLASEGNNKPHLDQLSFIQCLTAEGGIMNHREAAFSDSG